MFEVEQNNELCLTCAERGRGITALNTGPILIFEVEHNTELSITCAENGRGLLP